MPESREAVWWGLAAEREATGFVPQDAGACNHLGSLPNRNGERDDPKNGYFHLEYNCGTHAIMVQDVKQKASNDDTTFDQAKADEHRKQVMVEKIRETHRMLREARKEFKP